MCWWWTTRRELRLPIRDLRAPPGIAHSRLIIQSAYSRDTAVYRPLMTFGATINSRNGRKRHVHRRAEQAFHPSARDPEAIRKGPASAANSSGFLQMTVWKATRAELNLEALDGAGLAAEHGQRYSLNRLRKCCPPRLQRRQRCKCKPHNQFLRASATQISEPSNGQAGRSHRRTHGAESSPRELRGAS